MKKYLLLFLFLVNCVLVFPQSNSKQKRIQELEAELARLQSEIDQFDGAKTTIFDEDGQLNMENATVNITVEKTTYIEIPGLTDEQFIQVCHASTPAASRGARNLVISSRCVRDGNLVVNNAFIKYLGDDSKNEELTVPEINKELIKLQKQREYYREMIGALEHEMAFNFVEIVDDSGNLLRKNAKIVCDNLPGCEDALKELHEYAVSRVRDDLLVDEAPIDNPNYNFTTKAISLSERVLKYIPGGSKVTNHYLWSLVKSSPDVGKMLGSGGAMINIYFQKKDYYKKLQDIEDKEQELRARLNIIKSTSTMNLQEHRDVLYSH